MKTATHDPSVQLRSKSNVYDFGPFAILASLIFASLAISGCGNQSENRQQRLNNQTQTSSAAVNEHRKNAFLARAINLIKRETLTNLGRFEDSITQSLNSAWREGGEKKNKTAAKMKEQVPSWKRAALLETLPKRFQDTVWFRSVDKTDFYPTDAFYLQESYWLDQLQSRIISKEQSRRFLFLTHAKGQKPKKLWEALKAKDPRLNNQTAQELSDAMMLFDWTVRNVSGDDFYGPVTDPNQLDAESLVIGSVGKPNSERGIRGAGYGRAIWQLLQYGRGDGWQRGHLFLQLARHARIPACVIAIKEKKETKELPRVSAEDVIPWAIGVSIGDQIYLFDSRLGLPLFHKDSMAVLTLKEAAKDSSLLRWQGLSSSESNELQASYPVKAEELKDLVALLDYPAESLSLRMAFLQQSLTGSQRIPLVFDPTEDAQAFEKSSLIKEVRLWGLPEEIHVFRATVDDAKKRATRDRIVSAKLGWVHTEESYVDDFPLIREAKLLFLLGKFQLDQSGLTKDCRSSLLELLYTKKDIDSVLTNRDLQKKLGLYQENQSGKDFQNAIAGMQGRMELIRSDVQMHLANTLIDMESYSSALNWLNRVESELLGVSGFSGEKWAWSSEYLKGRCLEANGKIDEAIEVFKNSAGKSPNANNAQRYGNVLRARILREFQKKMK